MRWQCKGKPGEHFHGRKVMGIVFALSMMIYTVIAIMLMKRIANQAEILALTNALDDMGDDLTDEEQDGIRARIRCLLAS